MPMLQNRANCPSGFLVKIGVVLGAWLAFSALMTPQATGQRRQQQNVNAPKATFAPAGPQCECAVSVKSVVGESIPARIRLIPYGGGLAISAELADGQGRISAPQGTYTAGVYAYDAGVPILVHVQSLTMSPGAAAELKVAVLEGASGNRRLSAFDKDFDLVLDRVELEQGTDPENALSVPLEKPTEWPSPVLSPKSGWLRGELHAYSSHGPGTEPVGQLIKRAEAAGLDFLAITDPNTLAAAQDPEFKSNKVVLIPAMEWQHPTLGSALIYKPSSLPPANIAPAEAQALANKLQAQGCVIAIAHPTTPGRVWQWGLNYCNAVEVWYGDWRATAPIDLNSLSKEWKLRNDENEWVNSIALAAATIQLSANGQAALYYDLETTRGLRASMIGGSGSTGKKQRLGSPLTYVWAKEKSANAIVEGIRLGRTFVNAGPNAPFVEFAADIMADGSTDIGPGGMIPINVKSQFYIAIEGAEGARMELLFNGYPVKSRVITHAKYVYSVGETPGATGVYRVRVLSRPKSKGYGPSEVLAMSSPIFAHSYYVDPSKQASNDGWIDLESTWEDPQTVKDIDYSSLDPSQVVTLNEGKKPSR